MSDNPLPAVHPDPTLLDADAVARSFGSQLPRGLTAAVAARRLVDDIASSAQTLIEATRQVRASGFRPPVCIAVHALFTP